MKDLGRGFIDCVCGHIKVITGAAIIVALFLAFMASQSWAYTNVRKQSATIDSAKAEAVTEINEGTGTAEVLKDGLEPTDEDKNIVMDTANEIMGTEEKYEKPVSQMNLQEFGEYCGRHSN